MNNNRRRERELIIKDYLEAFEDRDYNRALRIRNNPDNRDVYFPLIAPIGGGIIAER